MMSQPDIVEGKFYKLKNRGRWPDDLKDEWKVKNNFVYGEHPVIAVAGSSSNPNHMSVVNATSHPRTMKAAGGTGDFMPINSVDTKPGEQNVLGLEKGMGRMHRSGYANLGSQKSFDRGLLKEYKPMGMHYGLNEESHTKLKDGVREYEERKMKRISARPRAKKQLTTAQQAAVFSMNKKREQDRLKCEKEALEKERELAKAEMRFQASRRMAIERANEMAAEERQRRRDEAKEKRRKTAVQFSIPEEKVDELADSFGNLQNAMGAYEMQREQLPEWRGRQFDELPQVQEARHLLDEREGVRSFEPPGEDPYGIGDGVDMKQVMEMSRIMTGIRRLFGER